jgi:CHAT domain-containing protein
LWDVADAPTSHLVPLSTAHGWAASTKPAALRAAQLALIRDSTAGRVRVTTAAGEITILKIPRFWAGFILLGEPE